MIFKRESKRMLKKQIAKMEKMGWTMDEDSDAYITFSKKTENWNGDKLVDHISISRLLDEDGGSEKPATILKCSFYDAHDLQDARAIACSMTAPEAWTAVGIAVAKGWRAMK